MPCKGPTGPFHLAGVCGETKNLKYRKIIGISGEQPMNASGGVSRRQLRV